MYMRQVFLAFVLFKFFVKKRDFHRINVKLLIRKRRNLSQIWPSHDFKENLTSQEVAPWTLKIFLSKNQILVSVNFHFQTSRAPSGIFSDQIQKFRPPRGKILRMIFFINSIYLIPTLLGFEILNVAIFAKK